MKKSPVMTVSQVAAALGESQSTIVRRIQSGALEAEKMEGRLGMFLIPRDAVDKLIAERAAELEAELARLNEAAS
jgi:excisionase family DNA binding protein